MKAWRRSCAGLLAVLWLSGCGNEGSGEATEEQQQEPPAEVISEPPEAPADVAPLTVEIAVSAALRDDRRLMIEGETNLPDDARLQVVVERELSGVRWQSRTSVSQERFTAGPFGPGSGLPDGGYTLTVHLVEASVQPATVRERIGDKGEHLAGPLVRSARHGLGQVASYSRRYLIGSEPRRATDQVEVLEVE
ncbi:hypothetical protein HOP62_07380 [Halomonas sp. MCCC 1A17488]|uniref:Uncharacterized protein n=1 Tax=Billgrantia sulfidoxydans TaxID=2733484 RepID=A0ABX7W1X2_9GAMM|nr:MULTISPECIES: hypothetical protein [Halomonas]MCE8015894.1 hypothetical protein [Halomonas sp. MCCC 1A17488]MCG3239227.1 hypothetical protein [Halomonas sp. MCCC 1A17488]QPP50838.1 hypothetical protein I4484_07015 [Halomonas sp. SS10-MC5]QTP54364.1 hypothetical protein HNO51_06465 [Halomonas sulfidoxydans]